MKRSSALLPTLTALALMGDVVGRELAAQDQVEQSTRTEESFIPNYAVAGSYFTWVGESDFSDASGSLSQWEAGIDANLPLLLTESLRITGGLEYRFNQLDFSGAPSPFADLGFDLHRIDVPFNFWQNFGDRWKLWLRLQPGLYSDFADISSDDLSLTALALFSYRWTDRVRISFGPYYSRDLGEERLLPAFGIIYEPNSHWSLGLAFPRANVVYAPNENWLFTGRALLSGAGWNIADPTGGNADAELDYQSLRVGLGVDRRLSGPWWAYLEGGAQLAQEITIEDVDDPISQDLDSTYFVTLGVKLRF